MKTMKEQYDELVARIAAEGEISHQTKDKRFLYISLSKIDGNLVVETDSIELETGRYNGPYGGSWNSPPEYEWSEDATDATVTMYLTPNEESHWLDAEIDTVTDRGDYKDEMQCILYDDTGDIMDAIEHLVDYALNDATERINEDLEEDD